MTLDDDGMSRATTIMEENQGTREIFTSRVQTRRQCYSNIHRSLFIPF